MLGNMDLNVYAKKHKNRSYVEKIIDEELVLLLENSPSRILEVGCGDGALAFRALKDFSKIKKYIAFDPSSERTRRAAEICQAHLKEDRLQLVNKLPSNMSDEEKPELVVSEQVIEHVENEQEFIESLFEVCAQNGLAYISTVFIDGPKYYFTKTQQVNGY